MYRDCMTTARRYHYERHELRTEWPTQDPHGYAPHQVTREGILLELERYRGRRDTAEAVLAELEARADLDAPRWAMLAPSIRYRVTIAAGPEVTP
jgi:hypothetical protein